MQKLQKLQKLFNPEAKDILLSDFLDPVQVTTKNMETESLSLKYGKDIVFYGATDTQKVLPFGTTDEVKNHCSDLIGKLNTYGNFIIAPSNNFMSGTPYRNILTVYDTVKSIKAQMP